MIPIPFIWYEQYYIPWAKGALNRQLPAKLNDDTNTDSEYRSAIRAWRERKGLGSSVIMDEATQLSLVTADNNLFYYIQWFQSCLFEIYKDPTVVPVGVKNERTRVLLKAFQKWRGLKDDGICGPKTESALFVQTGIKPPGRYKKIPAYGNIELPKPKPPEDPDPTYMTHSSTWAGVGVKMGGMGGVGSHAGQESIRAYMRNYKRGTSSFVLDIIGTRHGAGVGASAGGAFVVVTGIYDPNDLKTIELGGMDFSIALGGPWGSAAKLLKNSKAAVTLMRAARAGKWTGTAAELIDSAETLKRAVAAAMTDPESTEVDVKVIDFSTGAEGSVYYTVSRFRVSEIEWT